MAKSHDGNGKHKISDEANGSVGVRAAGSAVRGANRANGIVEERRAKGRAVLEQLTGSAVDTSDRYSALHPAFIDWVTEFACGQVWSRPALDAKTRSLCTISALTAMGRLAGLKIHIKGALGNGATEEEILETILHMAVYAGFPATQDGLIVAREVFANEHPDFSLPREVEVIEIEGAVYPEVVPGD